MDASSGHMEMGLEAFRRRGPGYGPQQESVSKDSTKWVVKETSSFRFETIAPHVLGLRVVWSCIAGG